jgi:hypothetical protein
MKPKLIAVALLLALASAARADFLPITLTAGSYTEDMVVEKTAAAAPGGAATTASMDAGTGNTGNSWYEQGYNAAAPTTGLPAAGSTLAAAAFPTHQFKMAPSYTANNVAMIDSTHTATLTLASPAAFSALSLLASAGNGPVTIDFTVHHMDGTSESGMFNAQDWFNNNPIALNANGRVDVVSGAFDSVNGGNPRLYSVDVSLVNRSSPVTSVDLNYDPANTGGTAAIFALSGQASVPVTLGQTIQWGLIITNINNPNTTDVITNSDGSISITAAGGDTYGSPDSFTYAYQQVTGDFDIRVQVLNVAATDPKGQDSPKGSLMVRASLAQTDYDFQINALPPLPSGRKGQIETIGRVVLANDTDDLPGRGLNYGPGGGVNEPYQGDTTDFGYCTYPDVWLRIQRQGERLMSYFATDNTTDAPATYASNPGSTNGWQLLGIFHAGPNFPKTLYVGLSTVAHNTVGGNSYPAGTNTVTSTYANYGPTPTPPSNPSSGGAPALPGTGPGPFPNTKVLAANFDGSVSSDGMGYPPNIVQSSQGAAQPIIWNTGDGFGGVTRDIIANISGQSPDGFCFARYQAGAFDFQLSPRDPVAALQNLGPYSNPLRERYSAGGTNVPASQAWSPSPNYGFVYTTVHKNGQIWNDTSPSFYSATYVQLDGVATGQGYDMIGGHYRGAQFYTRSTKLVTGTPLNAASSGPSSGALQRCAIPVSIAWFPYDQGWKAGYFDGPQFNTTTAGTPYWKRGNGWGLNSGTALTGFPVAGGQALYNSPSLLTWQETPLGSGTFSGLAVLSLSGVNSVNDGMLFTIGNDENNSIRGPSASNAALPDGSGWYVAVRDMETSKADPTVYATGGGSDAGASFSFVYIPYNADNLIGGHIAANGTTIKGTGSFSVSHPSTGVYALTIPGKTGTNGVLLLQNTGYLVSQPVGYTNVVDTSYLAYEYGGTNTPANAFIINTRYVDDTGGGEGVVKLRDAEFNFVYVDFQNPVAPPGTVSPVLTITPSSPNQVVVSWNNGPGFILQKTSSLVHPVSWTDVGPGNPSAPIATTSSPLYFRVRSP